VLSQYEWVKKHLRFLLDLKNSYLSRDSACPHDVEYGFWSLKKLIAINYLILKFGTLALTGGFTHCFYLDVLAGSGILKLENDVIPGSAMVALAAETTRPHFAKYFFIEKVAAKANVLEERLGRVAKGLGDRKFEVIREDCNRALPRVLEEIYREDPEHSCFLALFDPEGYTETAWSTIEILLGRGKGDLIFNFTEGVARNVQKARDDPSYLPSLRRHFGEPEDVWLHLNGYDELIEHFGEKLALVGRIKRTTFRIDIRDEENRPLYGLLLATGSRGFANIIGDLKRRLDSTGVIHLKNIYAELTGKGKPLDTYY
jgi:three-Cys-motif partner protein